MAKNDSIETTGSDTSKYKVSEEVEWVYPLAGYFLIAFLASEFGNISLMISIIRKQKNTVTATFIKGMTINGMVRGCLVILPTFTALVGGVWYFGQIGCVIQGTIINVSDTITHSLMFCLAFERYSVVVNKKEMNDTKVAKLITYAVYLLSAILGSLSLVHLDSYEYATEIFKCRLSSQIFSVIFDVCVTAIPSLIILIMMTACLKNIHICGPMNRVMDFDMETQTVGSPLTFDRRSRFRASLFPRQTDGSMTYTSAGITVAQSKATVALAYFNIPLAFMSLISFGFRIAGLIYKDSTGHMFLRLSMITYVAAYVAQPYTLLSASSTLRKAFINFVRQRHETITPSFRVIGVSPVAKPREDVFTTGEVPDFLRPSSGMRIQVRMSSSVDLKEQSADMVSELSGTSLDMTPPNADNNNEVGNNQCRTNNRDDRRLSCITSTGSVDSVFVRVGTSVDAPHRWSLSTGSIITVDLPECSTIPFSRPRSQISRRLSEHQDYARHYSSSATPPVSPKIDDAYRRQTLTLPYNSQYTSVSCTRPMNTSYTSRKRLNGKGIFSENSVLLPTVQDLGSKECSPRTSNQMSVKSYVSSPIQEDKNIINNDCEQRQSQEKSPTDTSFVKVEITDLT